MRCGRRLTRPAVPPGAGDQGAREPSAPRPPSGRPGRRGRAPDRPRSEPCRHRTGPHRAGSSSPTPKATSSAFCGRDDQRVIELSAPRVAVPSLASIERLLTSTYRVPIRISSLSPGRSVGRHDLHPRIRRSGRVGARRAGIGSGEVAARRSERLQERPAAGRNGVRGARVPGRAGLSATRHGRSLPI